MTIHESMSDQKKFSIQEVEAAINNWRTVEGVDQGLGPRARELADVYGFMIFNRTSQIDSTELTTTQLQALIDTSEAIDAIGGSN